MPSRELFALCEKKDVDGIITFISSETNKNQKARKLRETLSSCQQRDVSDMWSELYAMTTEAIMGLDDDEEKIKHTFDLLDAVVFIARTTLHNEKDPVPPSLFETAVLLHGVLVSLPEEALNLKSDISQLLELWWRRGLDGKEELGVNTLHFFLEDAQSTGKAVKVKRVWGLHEALKLVNFGSSEVEDLKQKLLTSIHTKPFLREPEGRKFLAYLFTMSPEFTDQLFQRFKQHFPSSTRDISAFYGEVFFRAWKQASGPCLEKLENDCIQNLMNHAVHARRDGGSNIFSLLSRLLQYIHNQKIQRGVNDMLLKLYNPILWRSLNVPNCDVRANAIFLLCDVFPLTCPVDKDELINKQCEALVTALYDDYPVARRIAVEGVCRIMSSYWELLPNLTIKLFITKLLQDHLNDANSSDVRLAVVRGMTQLLDNHLCHPLLKSVLPTMRDHVHDTSETVRKAMLDLLLKAKKIRAIKFWMIVPVEHLLARLKEDTPDICKKIVKLLINSYMPAEESPEEKITRLTHLIREDAAAARKFFQYAPNEIKLDQTVKYLTLLSRVMLVLIKRSQSQQSNEDANESTASNTSSVSETRDQSSIPKDDDDGSEDEDPQLSLKNTDIMMGLIEAMYLMWDAVATELHTPQNTDIRHELQKRYSVVIPQMLKIFQEPRAYAAIMLLSGFLPSTRVPILSDSCMSKLRNMTAENHMGTTHLQNFIGTMCKWRFSNAILEMIETSVKAGLEEKTIAEYKPGGSMVKKKSGAKCVMLKETIKPDPPLALEYLEILLEKDMCREVILAEHTEALRDTMMALESSVEILKAMNSCESETSANNGEFVLKTFFLYLRIALLLHKHEETNPKPMFNNLLIWAQEDLVPQLKSSQGIDAGVKRSRSDGELAFKTVEVIMKMSWHLMMVGCANEDFTSQTAKLCVSCLEADGSLRLIESVMTCLQWVTDARRTLDRETHSEGQLLSLIPNVMGKVYVCLASYIKHHKQTCSEVLWSIKPQLTEIFNTMMKNTGHSPCVEDMMTATLMAVLAEMEYASRKESLDEPVDITSLPPLSALMMKVLSTPSTRLHFFLQELNDFMASGSMPDLHHAHGCVHLLRVVSKTKGKVLADHVDKCEQTLKRSVDILAIKIEDEDEDSRALLKEIRHFMGSSSEAV